MSAGTSLVQASIDAQAPLPVQGQAAQDLRAQTYRGTHLRDSRGVYAWKDERFPSITTLLKQLDKPALPRWASKSVAEHVADFVTNIVPTERIPWPRVQKYLGNVEELKNIPWKYAEKRRDIGSNLHDVAEQITGGTIVNPDVFADDLRPLVRSHLDFCSTEAPEFMAMETGCFHRDIGYACTLDTIVRLPKVWEKLGLPPDTQAVMDYKTGKDVYDEAVIQVNAQRISQFVGLRDGTELAMPVCQQNLVLLIQPIGWRLVQCPVIPNIEEILRALVTLYNFKQAGHKMADLASQEVA